MRHCKSNGAGSYRPGRDEVALLPGITRARTLAPISWRMVIEARIRRPLEPARHHREFAREHVVIRPLRKLGRDAEAAVAFIQVAAAFDELEILRVGAVVFAAGR